MLLLLILVSGLLVLLAIPVDVRFSLRHCAEQRSVSCRVDWLFGAVQVRVLPRTSRPAAVRKSRPRGRKGSGVPLTMLHDVEFARRTLRMIRDLLRHIRIHALALQMRMGLSDPADTGRLWGVVGALDAMLTLPAAARIRIEPDFNGEAFEIEGQGHVRMIPIQLLLVIAAFLMSPATLRVR